VARPVDGGFRVSGRWAWGSGTANADWILGGCRVEGEPPAPDGRPPAPRLMIARAEEVERLDTWHVAGLSGTGSGDFAFHDVFVPGRRALRLGVDRPLARPLYAFPAFGLLAMGIAAVALGLAGAAIEALVDLAGAKRPQGSRRSLAERPAAQSDVAEAQALARSARAFLHEAVDAAWQSARGEGRLRVAHRRDVRLATTHAVRSAARAVDLMYHLAGGSSVYRRSPLQRIFRDVHVATQHAMVAPSTFEVTGRLLLGLETDTTTL
jgi:alkylation response protein AidB-like acyl-CoA dehydrogenase